MRRNHIIITLLAMALWVGGVTLGQTPKDIKPTLPAPTEGQQKAFQALLKDVNEANAAEVIAKQRAELALSKLQQEIFKTMALLKLSPDEYDPQLNEGKITFAPKPKASP